MLVQKFAEIFQRYVCRIYNTLCAYCVGESAFEADIESDSNEHSHDEKTELYLCTLCDKCFAMKDSLKDHKRIHPEENISDNFGDISFEVKVETDSDSTDVIKHPYEDKQRSYLCMVCGKGFKTEKFLNRHELAHETSYSCTLCDKQYARKDALKRHEQKHSEENIAHKKTKKRRELTHRSYLCMMCSKQFKSKRCLKRHELRHTVGTEEKLLCTHCGKCCATQRGLDSHMIIHNREYECTECGKCFRSAEELTKHGLVNCGEKPFECTVCSKRFLMSARLASHSRAHCTKKSHVGHTGEESRKCNLCDKVFTRPDGLDVHMRVHTGDKPYKCSQCDKAFSKSSNLYKHKRCVHEKQKLYECPYCRKLFKSKEERDIHVCPYAGVARYQCMHCSDRFIQQRQLRVHLLKSHNEGNWSICHICARTFTNPDHLKGHMRLHQREKGETTEKSYMCAECPRFFFSLYALKSHQVVHSNAKPFCCGACGKLFKRKVDVTQHLRGCLGN